MPIDMVVNMFGNMTIKVKNNIKKPSDFRGFPFFTDIYY